MLSLIETLIGFSVVMLLLSLLVKTMTTVVKNHIDYYSENLKAEVDRFLCGTIGCRIQEVPALQGIQWNRLSEEFLTKENMVWWLKKLGMKPEKLAEAQEDIEARLEIHKKNLQFAFAKRTNYIALALGLALCLSMNINAFTIWDTLYRDQSVRAKLASAESVQAAQQLKEEIEKKLTAPQTPEAEKQELEKQRDELNKQLAHFRGAVDFGIGRVWRERPGEKEGPVRFFFYEFFGSLLTGILVSIGAPYWHDLLKALVSLRTGVAPPKEKEEKKKKEPEPPAAPAPPSPAAVGAPAGPAATPVPGAAAAPGGPGGPAGPVASAATAGTATPAGPEGTGGKK